MLHASSPQPRHPIVSPNSVTGATPSSVGSSSSSTSSSTTFQSPNTHNKLLFNHANHQQYVYPLSATGSHYTASSVVSPTRSSKHHKDSMWSKTWLQLLVTMTVVLLFVLALSSFSTVDDTEDVASGSFATDFSATAFIDGHEGNVERAQLRTSQARAQTHKKKVKRSKFHTLTASVVAGASLISPLRSARAALNFATKEDSVSPAAPPVAPTLSPAAAAAVTSTTSVGKASHTKQPQSSPRVLLRILASGSHYHAEFDRLLHSLLEAQYELGVDMIDIEILVDLPRNLTLPIEQKFKGTLSTTDVAFIDGNTSPAENPDTPGDINADEDGQGPLGTPSSTELKQLLQSLLKNDPAYQALKSEHELHEILARNFQWIHGLVSVRTVHFSTKQLAGFFNQFLSWNPLPYASASVAASSNSSPMTSSSSPEYAFMIKETHVLSKQWFQVVKRLIKQYEAQPVQSDSTSTQRNTAGGNLFGIQFEPAEIFLGIDASTPTGEYQEKKFFQDPLVKASASTSSKNDAPSILYGQMSSSVDLGIGGGLLLPTHRYAEFRAWVVHLGLLARDAQDTPISDDYGAPIAWVYNELTAFPFNHGDAAASASANVFIPCVPGLISNHWFDTQVAVKNGKEQWRAFHDRRKYEPWFLFGLLNRFMYERGYYNMIPFWVTQDPSSSSHTPKVQTLLTSPKFLFGHSHQQSDDPALLQQQQLSGAHMHDSSQTIIVESDPASWTNLIPMRFDLISNIDFNKWDAQLEKAVASPQLPKSVFDFAGKLFDPSAFKPASSIDCNLWLRNVPTNPPSTEPNKEEREHIEQVLAAKARLKASQTAPSSTGPAVDPEAAALELQSHINEYKGLSQKELLQMALRTAEQHKAVVPLSPLEVIEKAAAAQQPQRPSELENEADDDLPSAVASNSTNTPKVLGNSSSNSNHSLIDLEAFHDNVTALEQERWEAYESDFHYELSKASIEEKERLMKEHEKLRLAHEAHLRVLQEELEKKTLILSLKNQLEAIQNREIEEKENALLKKYKEKKKKLKKELMLQKKLQAEQKEALKEQERKAKEEADAAAKSKKDDSASKKKASEKEKGKKDSKAKAGDDKAKKDKSLTESKADSKKDKDKKKPKKDEKESSSEVKPQSDKDKAKDNKDKDKKSKGDKAVDKDKKKSDKSDKTDKADESKKDKKSKKPADATGESESEATDKKKKKSPPPDSDTTDPSKNNKKKNDKSKSKEQEESSNVGESAAESKSSEEKSPKKKDSDKSNTKSKEKTKESDKNKKEKDTKGKEKEKDSKSKGKDKSKDSEKDKSNSKDKSKNKKDDSKKKESPSSEKGKATSSTEGSSSSDAAEASNKEDAVDSEGVIDDAEYERIMAARRERKKNKQHRPLYLG